MCVSRLFKWLVFAVLILFGGMVYAGGGNNEVKPETEDHPWGDLKGTDDTQSEGMGILGKFTIIVDWNTLPIILITTPQDVQKEKGRVKRAIPPRAKGKTVRWLPFRR